jgi:SAM-dependent methyltransferase
MSTLVTHHCPLVTHHCFMNPAEYARMHALETEYWWFAGRRAIIASMGRAYRDHSRQSQDWKVLDIGCGTGANLPLLCEIAAGNKNGGGRVTALDYSPLALQFARDHLGDLPVNLLRGDAAHLPFPDNHFDVVTMLDVLEHIEDDRAATGEIHRVLKPGGAFILSVPAYQNLWSAHDEALHHFRRYEYHALRRLLRDSGLPVWRMSFAMSLMPPAAWLWRRLILPFQPRRPQDAKRHSEGAVLPTVPRWANRALIEYLKLEGRILARRPIQFGTSLVAVARKRS